MFEHNGVRLEFNASNPKDLRRLHEARAYLGQRYAKLSSKHPSDLAESADMMEECVLAVCDMFDNVFGEGTANALFGGEISDFETAMGAYEALERHVENQARGLAERIAKYMPEENRR